MGTFARRAFLSAGVALAAAAATRAGAATTPIRAVAFDAFTTFDPRSVTAVAEGLYPGAGERLAAAWRTRQFEYQWLHALSGRYADFWSASEGALEFAAASLGLELTGGRRDELMQAIVDLRAWPDARPTLEALRARGMHLALLSNATPALLEGWVARAGLGPFYEHVLSTDRIRSYKPDPRAYQMAVDAFGITPGEIAFAAFGGWDAAGAKWFGYPTFWVNRMRLPVEGLGVRPDAMAATLPPLVDFVAAV
jgi:2-haloacid dehalogenase